METSAKWYFDTLPFHPQPKYLESFCSYVLRIVEGNNIGGIGALCSLSFPGSYRNIYRKFTDYPLSSFSSLIMTTGCQDSLLLATTFYHLGKKFGRTPQPRSMRGFMGESIARYLRFCPMCLHDMHIQYYSLKWRFLQVLGCT